MINIALFTGAIFVRVTNLSSLSNNLKNTINIKNQYKMNEKGREELTMNAVPKAVNYLIEEIAEMRATLDKMEKQLGLGSSHSDPQYSYWQIKNLWRK